MKLTVFQSAEGDCLLVTGNDGKTMLVDGGMGYSYTEHVSPTLGKLREQGGKLDLVYVSHIDEDHISGVLKMVDDLVDWRVHKFHVGHGQPNHKAPKSIEPPEIAAIWHNSFHDMVGGKNAKPIESALAATAAVLSGADDPELREAMQDYRELATSTTQALKLSRRIGDKQLKIPLNKEYKRKLMMVRTGMPKKISFGGIKIQVIGPRAADLEILRQDWIKWLKTTAGKKAVVDLNKASQEDESVLGNAVPNLLAAFANDAAALAIALANIGARGEVTPPNLASLMVLLTEAGKTVLLTGDGHWDDILKGLKHHNLPVPDGIHVNVLKAQHHGALANFHPDFCKQVIADNYIFCGNGSHENPEKQVIEMVVASRVGPAVGRSTHPKVNDPFKLWFNNSPKESPKKAHMEMLVALVKKLADKHSGKIKFQFLENSHFELTV